MAIYAVSPLQLIARIVPIKTKKLAAREVHRIIEILLTAYYSDDALSRFGIFKTVILNE